MKKLVLALALTLVPTLAQAVGVSKIYPFATSDSYVLSDTDYQADGDRLSGNVPGTQARAALVNKALRQCSAMSGVLAKFIADHSASFTVIDSALALGTTVIAFETAIQDVIPSASTTASGKVELATQTETRNNTCPSGPCTTLAVTPDGLAATTATTSRAGLAKIATSTGGSNDMTAGTDDTKIVTPKGLLARTATTSRIGLSELATGAQAIAGDDVDDTTGNPVVVTPSALQEALGVFASSLTTPGYTTLPSGVILQWGEFNADGNPAQTFPIPFPNAVFTLQAISKGGGGGGHVWVVSLSTTGFDLDNSAAGNDNLWLAVGY